LHFLLSISRAERDVSDISAKILHLVNATEDVEEIRSWTTGESGLRIKGGEELTVSRTCKKNRKSLAQFWFGCDQPSIRD
jgi:hypothetical protein